MTYVHVPFYANLVPVRKPTLYGQINAKHKLHQIFIYVMTGKRLAVNSK